MTLNIFDQTNDQPTIDETQNYLEVLTGPGGKFDRTKYQSDEDMYKAIARGKVEADLYIDHFKERQDELRKDYRDLNEKYNAGKKLEEMIDQIKSQQQSNSNAPQANDSQAPAFDPQQLQVLVSSEIQKLRTSEKQKENFDLVKDKFTQHFGNNYQAAVNKQAAELGLTAEEVNDLALNKPKVLFKALGLDQPRQTENFQTPPYSNVRSGFAPQGENRNRAYYTKMRDEKPDLYRSPKIQLQMFEDAKKMGDAFFS